MARSRPPLRLRRNPLIVVLAQVRIAPVLRLADSVPEIQDQLRRNGFPRFSESQTQTVQFVGSPPPSAWQTSYLFTDRNAKRAVIVAPEHISLIVTAYESFEVFANDLQGILVTVGGVLGPELVERVGLRYVDLIQPREGEDVRDWLQPSLRGLDNLELENIRFNFELRGSTSLGEFVFRATRPKTGLIPADLQPFALEVTPAEPVVEGRYVVLDFDHFTAAPRDFDVPTLMDTTWGLHDFVDLAFRQAVTEDAFRAWGAT